MVHHDTYISERILSAEQPRGTNPGGLHRISVVHHHRTGRDEICLVLHTKPLNLKRPSLEFRKPMFHIANLHASSRGPSGLKIRNAVVVQIWNITDPSFFRSTSISEMSYLAVALPMHGRELSKDYCLVVGTKFPKFSNKFHHYIF